MRCRCLRQILHELSIGVENCEDLGAAAARLAAQHFDAIVVDCKDQSRAIELIAAVRKLPINKSTLIIGLVDGRDQVRDIFGQGANFIVYKPVSEERAGQQLARGARSDGARKADQVASLVACAGFNCLRNAENVPATLLGFKRRWPGHTVRAQIAATLQSLFSVQFARRQIRCPPLRRCGVAGLFGTSWNSLCGRAPNFPANSE